MTERWEIDSSHSSVHFSVRHLVIAKVRGSFARWSGTVQVPNGDFSQATVAVAIDASSIDTGVADRDGHLKSPDFFDVGQYPELRFVGKRVEPRTPARHLERWNIQQRRPLVGAVGPARAPKPEMVIIL